jgi:NADH:ubiquinone oxidoreductase subunit F (NADH-binding)
LRRGNSSYQQPGREKGNAADKASVSDNIRTVGKPTVINNVETLMNVPLIMQNGPEWFRNFGTASSPGTKIFAIAGKKAVLQPSWKLKWVPVLKHCGRNS